MNSEGNQFGPDLAKLDPKRKPTDILLDILEPSKQINENFQTYALLLDSGKTMTGLIVGETDESVKLVVDPLAMAEPNLIAKDEIEGRAVSKTSTMPQGLMDRLTEEEILDLLAYVVSRGNDKAPAYRL